MINPNTLNPPAAWHPQDAMDELTQLARDRKVIVEVGTWLGHSALALAATCPGHVYCVDHWRGTPHGTGTVDDPLSFYELFLTHIRSYEAGDRIVPLYGDSAAIAQLFTGHPIDLLYVDGAHDELAVLTDLRKWDPLVKHGGIICGDDYSEVRQVIERYFGGQSIEVRARRLWIVYKE